MDKDYDKAVDLVLTQRRVGPAFLKQALHVSDSKITRLLKEMQKNGVISAAGAGGARTILQDASTARSAARRAA